MISGTQCPGQYPAYPMMAMVACCGAAGGGGAAFDPATIDYSKLTQIQIDAIKAVVGGAAFDPATIDYSKLSATQAAAIDAKLPDFDPTTIDYSKLTPDQIAAIKAAVGTGGGAAFDPATIDYSKLSPEQAAAIDAKLPADVPFDPKTIDFQALTPAQKAQIVAIAGNEAGAPFDPTTIDFDSLTAAQKAQIAAIANVYVPFAGSVLDGTATNQAALDKAAGLLKLISSPAWASAATGSPVVYDAAKGTFEPGTATTGGTLTPAQLDDLLKQLYAAGAPGAVLAKAADGTIDAVPLSTALSTSTPGTAQNDVLKWDAASGKWVPGQPVVTTPMLKDAIAALAPAAPLAKVVGADANGNPITSKVEALKVYTSSSLASAQIVNQPGATSTAIASVKAQKAGRYLVKAKLGYYVKPGGPEPKGDTKFVEKQIYMLHDGGTIQQQYDRDRLAAIQDVNPADGDNYGYIMVNGCYGPIDMAAGEEVLATLLVQTPNIAPAFFGSSVVCDQIDPSWNSITLIEIPVDHIIPA